MNVEKQRFVLVTLFFIPLVCQSGHASGYASNGFEAQFAGQQTGATFRLSTREVAPTISFGSKGFVLASKLIRGLPVSSLNIPRADIDFFRIKPKFLGEFRDNFAGEDLYYYQSRNLNKSADLVYSGR